MEARFERSQMDDLEGVPSFDIHVAGVQNRNHKALERCSFRTGPPEFLQGCLCLRVVDLERHLGLDRAVECEPARGSGKVRTRGWMCWPSHKKLTWR